MSATDLPPEPVHTCSIRVYYYDTDAAGVVHNIAYLRFIEEARTRLAEHLGWTLEEMGRGEVVPVVARTEIDYLRPAKLGDTLRVESRITHLGRARFDLGFELYRGADEAAIVRCRQVMACVRLESGRPRAVRTPSFWREKWPHLADGGQ